MNDYEIYAPSEDDYEEFGDDILHVAWMNFCSSEWSDESWKS